MDPSVVRLHCNHFKDPSELSCVLKTLLRDERFQVEMRDDMYTIRIYNSSTTCRDTTQQSRRADVHGGQKDTLR
ncbi:hypothetical protein GGR57DRAFT_250610 [Xylariaceae sp. FL1272]|nr:hypothetical protein GGR57DRAFT_250610 [Xylariaceae sp. FL1272]